MGWSSARRAIAAAFGRRGARRRMQVLSKEERSRVARQAAQARWAGTPPDARSEAGRKAVQARWQAYRARKKAARRVQPVGVDQR